MASIKQSRATVPVSILAVVVVALIGLAVSGCGGGSSSTSQGGATTAKQTNAETKESAASLPSKKAFIKKADKICATTDKTQSAGVIAFEVTHPEAGSSKAAQEEVVIAVGLPPIQEEVGRLATMAPPSGLKVEYAALVKEWKASLKAAEADPGSILGAGKNPFDKVDKMAGYFGFADCAHAV